MRRILAASSLVLIFLGVACNSAPTAPAAAAAPGAPSEAEMMARMAELGRPGPAHAKLAAMVGTFRADGEFWNTPGAPSTKSEGTSVNTLEFGGRFVKQVYDSTYEGQPFTGVGYTGFDNVSQHYVGVWLDSMTTGIMPVSTGTIDASGKVITFCRSFVDPMTGKPAQTREVLTIDDANHHSFEWHQTGPDGKEFLMMKFGYTRVK